LDATYDKLPGDLSGSNGNALINAPENAFNFVALYETSLSGGGEASFRYEYIYQDEAEGSIQNYPEAQRPDYELSNFRVGYTTPDGDWEVAAWVKNAFDEEWEVSAFFNEGIGSVRQPALPRTYGVSLTWSNF